MSTGGLLRWRLANRLRSAYAVGLLTEDTFAHRLDHLYGGTLVDPDKIVGDLTFRSRPRRPSLDQRWREFRSRWQRGEIPEEPPQQILPLDWTGSTTEVLIGRGSQCDLVITGLTVSRHHAQLFFREGGWIVIDLGSTNGTYINGARVQRSQLLPGDLLGCGCERLLVD